MALIGSLNWKQKKPIETDKPSRYLSTHDILTGLYTRAYFEEEMARLESEGEFPVSIVMADVDGKGGNLFPNNAQGENKEDGHRLRGS
jgi:GGDEF domain-containing protein